MTFYVARLQHRVKRITDARLDEMNPDDYLYALWFAGRRPTRMITNGKVLWTNYDTTCTRAMWELLAGKNLRLAPGEGPLLCEVVRATQRSLPVDIKKHMKKRMLKQP